MNKAKEEKIYKVITQMIVAGDMSRLTFRVSEQEYKRVQEQIRKKPDKIVLTLLDHQEPMLLNINEHVITVNTMVEDAPKNIILPDVAQQGQVLNAN